MQHFTLIFFNIIITLKWLVFVIKIITQVELSDLKWTKYENWETCNFKKNSKKLVFRTAIWLGSFLFKLLRTLRATCLHKVDSETSRKWFKNLLYNDRTHAA